MAERFGWSHGALLCGPDAGETPAVPREPPQTACYPAPLAAWKRQYQDFRLRVLDFIDIYGALDDNEQAEYQRDYSEEAKTMSRFAERLREEGVQQGEAPVPERLLRLKFGTLPDAVQHGSTVDHKRKS